MDNKYDIVDEYLGGERKSMLSKEELYMAKAILSSKESLDPSTQVGACYVDEDGNTLSTGCNNNPREWNPNSFPWGKDPNVDPKNTKYPYIIHAEMRALMDYRGSISDFKNSTLYITLFPCVNCVKLLVSAGVKKIVYLVDDRKNTSDNICAKILLNKCGIEYVDFKEVRKNNINWVNLCLDSDLFGKEDNKVLELSKKNKS